MMGIAALHPSYGIVMKGIGALHQPMMGVAALDPSYGRADWHGRGKGRGEERKTLHENSKSDQLFFLPHPRYGANECIQCSKK